VKKLLILLSALVVLAGLVLLTGRISIPPDHALVYHSRLGGEPKIATGSGHWMFPLIFAKHLYPLGARSDTLRFEHGTFRTAESEPVGLDAIAHYDISPANLISLDRVCGGHIEQHLRGVLAEALGPMLENQPTFDLFRSGGADLAEPLRDTLRRNESLIPYALGNVDISSPHFEPGTERELAGALVREADWGTKVMIVGVDGADWDIIDPLIRAGDLPNFARLMESGTRASLESIHPMLSPRIWTSIATGKLPEEHGITDFVVKDATTGRMTPVTSNLRRSRALWNILSDLELPVGFVGWLMTWPAEEVDGFVVSDRMAYYAFNQNRSVDASPKKTYPDEMFESIQPLIVEQTEVTYPDIRRFLDVPRSMYEKQISKGYDPMDPIHNFRLIYATTETYRRIGLHLIDRPVRLFGLYFELVDAVSHFFVRHMPPHHPGITDDEFQWYRNAVFETYRYQDEILGDILDRVDDDTILIVLSDHGFRTGAERFIDDPVHMENAMLRVGPGVKAARAILDHAPVGILVLRGPGIRRGVEIGNASVMDIAPTVLYLLGLPVARDMPGRVLVEVLEPDVAAEHPVVTIASYETGEPRGTEAEAAPIASADDEAMLEKLAALGYVSPSASGDPFAEGVRLLREGDAENAIAPLKEAADANPELSPLWANLGLAYLQVGRMTEAGHAFRRAVAIKPDSPGVLSNLAVVLTWEGQYENAAEMLEKAVALAPDHAEMQDNLGVLYVHLDRPGDAQRQFERAVALSPEMPEPYGNLGALALGREDYAEARAQLERALLLSPGFLEAHVNLARVALATGEPDEARAHLKRALEIDPECPEAHLLAGRAHHSMGDATQARAAWRRAVELDREGDAGREAQSLLKE